MWRSAIIAALVVGLGEGVAYGRDGHCPWGRAGCIPHHVEIELGLGLGGSSGGPAVGAEARALLFVSQWVGIGVRASRQQTSNSTLHTGISIPLIDAHVALRVLVPETIWYAELAIGETYFRKVVSTGSERPSVSQEEYVPSGVLAIGARGWVGRQLTSRVQIQYAHMLSVDPGHMVILYMGLGFSIPP